MSEDLIQRSDQLDQRIDTSDAVQTLTKASRRNLVLIRILGLSILFDILISAALFLVALQAQRTAMQASSVGEREYTACLANNQSRAAELQLWEHVLALPPTTPQSPAQQKQAADFQVYVSKLYAPRKCTR